MLGTGHLRIKEYMKMENCSLKMWATNVPCLYPLSIQKTFMGAYSSSFMIPRTYENQKLCSRNDEPGADGTMVGKHSLVLVLKIKMQYIGRVFFLSISVILLK